MIEFLLEPEVLSAVVTVILIVLVWLVERVTKREIDEADGKRLRGVIRRVLVWLLRKFKKK